MDDYHSWPPQSPTLRLRSGELTMEHALLAALSPVILLLALGIASGHSMGITDVGFEDPDPLRCKGECTNNLIGPLGGGTAKPSRSFSSRFMAKMFPAPAKGQAMFSDMFESLADTSVIVIT